MTIPVPPLADNLWGRWRADIAPGANGDHVTAWPDIAGPNPARNITAPDQGPTLRTTGFGAGAGLQFTGTLGEGMRIPTPVLTNWSIYIMMSTVAIDPPNSANDLIVAPDGSYNLQDRFGNWAYYIPAQIRENIAVRSNSRTALANSFAASPQPDMGVAGFAAHAVMSDGVLTSAGAGGFISATCPLPAGLFVGEVENRSRFMSGFIAEILIYDTFHNVTQQASMTEWLWDAYEVDPYPVPATFHPPGMNWPKYP